jgi:hypothetical protein
MVQRCVQCEEELFSKTWDHFQKTFRKWKEWPTLRKWDSCQTLTLWEKNESQYQQLGKVN